MSSPNEYLYKILQIGIGYQCRVLIILWMIKSDFLPICAFNTEISGNVKLMKTLQGQRLSASIVFCKKRQGGSMVSLASML